LDVKEKRPRILVVEDDAALAAMYRSLMRLAGFDVYLTADAVSALRHIDDTPPDLVVLDLHLPGLRGETVLAEMTANPDLQHIPIIVVTGSDARMAVAQASAILRKPCDPGRLVALIEQHLGNAA
jgi:two-component system, sensor histidine kinase and response regulator